MIEILNFMQKHVTDTLQQHTEERKYAFRVQSNIFDLEVQLLNCVLFNLMNFIYNLLKFHMLFYLWTLIIVMVLIFLHCQASKSNQR
jgi:hypothetical protein